jgi:acetolactate synthase-1/2/3 large subunit
MNDITEGAVVAKTANQGSASEITGGELIARCLANEGVKFLIGLPCPDVDPLLAKLDDYGIRLVPIRHEAAAVHMAEGIYKSTGQVAAVFGNPGPGSSNLLPGVLTAMHEGVPVLVITAQHRPGIIAPSSPTTFQGQDQLEIFRPTVKWGGSIAVWERVPELFRMAFREMWNGRPGPVHLDIQNTVVYGTGSPAKAPIFPAAMGRAPLPQASRRQIEEAAELLARAKSPVIVSGAGVDRAAAGPLVRRIVEMLNCPVITTMSGRSSFPIDHTNHLPMYLADPAKADADVILVAGSRFGNLDLPFDKYWGDPLAKKLIHIDIDPRNIAVSRPATVGIVADIADALAGIADALAARAPTPADASRLAGYRAAVAAAQNAVGKGIMEWAGPGIHPAHVMLAVGEAFGRDACYAVDGGMTSLWAHSLLPATRQRSYLGILEFGMLGVGIPAAVGVKLADPAREVVCVTGDGAAGFNIMEMQSAVREGLKLTTVVLAEGSWSMEEPNELAMYGKTFGCKMGTVRWDKVAEGLGCHAEYVLSATDIKPALERARNHPGPALVCVKTSVEANLAMPQALAAKFGEVYYGPSAGA